MNLHIQALEEDILVDLVKLKFQQHCGALEYTAGQKVVDHHWKELEKLIKNWSELQLPWVTEKQDTTSISDRWNRVHKKLYGDKLDELVKPNNDDIEAVNQMKSLQK